MFSIRPLAPLNELLYYTCREERFILILFILILFELSAMLRYYQVICTEAIQYSYMDILVHCTPHVHVYAHLIGEYAFMYMYMYIYIW